MKVSISFLEIYNEKLKDLLSDEKLNLNSSICYDKSFDVSSSFTKTLNNKDEKSSINFGLQRKVTEEKKNLDIHEDKNGTIYVEGLKEIEVISDNECLDLLHQGII